MACKELSPGDCTIKHYRVVMYRLCIELLCLSKSVRVTDNNKDHVISVFRKLRISVIS
jgi:hypothetical protein